ncbi:MAG: DegT/DnrJ/EryC1/StrS family aminotransferase [Chloroflexi bacterium]|nr:DegT/DnrJ/EryC1/StrS family aminotransferase [Chloroflexota bacterium]
MNIPFVDLQAMHAPLHDEMMTAIEEVVSKGNFVLGHQARAFEEDFAAYSETAFAVGVDSGLSALKLALLAYDIGEGDEVILPANTFIASAAAVTFTGATPVLVDPEPDTYNIDPQKIEAAITKQTKAIMVVHLYGIPAKMDEIMAIAEEHNLIVVEDASHAHGARYNGQRIGSLGHIAGFSLYPAKNLGAFGDGGIITTADESVIEKLTAMRNCGQIGKYNHVHQPYNHRLDTIHAAILQIKLRVLDEWNEKRRQAAQWYSAALADTSVITPIVPDDTESVWHLYVIRTAQRDALSEFLKDRGIATGIHYPVPIHKTPFYQSANLVTNNLPISEAQAGQILSLPMFPGISKEQVQYVADSVREFEANYVTVRL